MAISDMQGLSEKNPRYFYDPSDFPFLQQLVKNTAVIKAELLELLNSGIADQWVRTFPHYVRSEKEAGWKVFSFVFFQIRYLHNARLCPKTAELIYSVPEIMSCDFSSLPGRTRILPHKGYSRMVLRAHLPLIVPEQAESCGIRVGNEQRHWKENELMIFDDSYEHEAWNNSDENRIVLMFDIPNPLWNYNASEISKFKIDHLDDPFLLSLAPRETWQQLFSKGFVDLQEGG